MEGSSSSGSGSVTNIGVQDWEAFCEFLRDRQPPRSLSDCTANDAVEFLRRLPSDEIEAVVGNLSADTFKKMFGSQKENPFCSQMVRTFLMKTFLMKYGKKKLSHHSVPGEYKFESTGRHHVDKENLFQMCLTTTDDVLVIAKKDAEEYFPSAAVLGGAECVLRFTDEGGRPWMFNYSYLNDRQSYALTKGWSSYVKEKQLGVGDLVFFQRHLTDSSMLFIGCSWRDNEPTLHATSSETLELQEVETPIQLKLPGINPIFVISCGDDQDSEQTYFISYILNELHLHGFTPCRYDLTRSTVTVDPTMLHKARVCIVIISMNNTRSQECLDAFFAIMGHLKANKLALIPVYFKLSRDYSKSARLEAFQVQRWREAMIKFDVFNTYQYMEGDEVMLAKSIVRDVCLLLNPEANKNLIGVNILLQSILPLLHCPQPSTPQIIGLWGMAGIGKTTITREIFRIQAASYDFSYFLPDFHLTCETKGLSHLRDEFFSKIFGEEKVLIDACDTKLSFTWDRFLDKRVLVILDGVSNARDAEVLVGGFGWFSGGHTIILTSRNRQVLVQCKAKELYEIPKLSESDSLRLCCQNATEQNWEAKMSLILELMNYASGIPLALRVLGSSVQKECINNEKPHLRRLRQHPPIEIQDAFRRSFDGLHDNEKNIFLDVACFFKGEKKYHVVNMLDGCGLFTDLGIYALIDESLISLVDNRLELPNIFQDAGRYVVCQENNEAGKRSRLWDSNDITDVLTKNSGTEAIEGIFLDASGLTFELSPTVFERMYRLRLLKLHCPTSENHCKVFLPQGLHSLPDELRLLHWEGYPLGSLPRNLNPKNLVELNMTYSNMTKLWKGTKNLPKLKRIILSHSLQLIKFPRLSKAMNLEHIDLEGCTSLVKVNSSILHHHKLTFLSLKNCSRLRFMPTTVHLESLEILNLSGCSELEDLHDFSPNLKELYLAGTAIIEMPSSIGDVTRLVTLDLENCKRLQHLPPGISNLKALITFKVSGCSNLKSLPILDAVFPRDPQRLNRKITMEESVPLKFHDSSRIIRVSRASGGKDRHSKVLTSKGPRDRRVRLSVSTALQFYDLQDRLGYDQPSKAVEWLIKVAEKAISELPPPNNTNFPMTDDENQNQTITAASAAAANSLSRSACSSDSDMSKNSSCLSLSRSELRDKARERARERTAKETKERDHNNNHTTSFTEGERSAKDRHSKVLTSKGLRDRRVRLSVSTAIQFYDLQDRLGYDQPSKAVEWLIKEGEKSISELPPPNNTNFPMTDYENQNQTLTGASAAAANSLSRSACSSDSDTSKNSSGLTFSRSELRDKARERARERTAKKTKKRDHNNHTTSFTELLNFGSDPVNTNRQWMAPAGAPAPVEYFSSGSNPRVGSNLFPDSDKSSPFLGNL